MLVRLRRSLGGLPPGLGQPVSNREARGRRAANRRPAAPGGAAPGGAAPGGAAPGGAAPGGAAPGGAAPGGAAPGAGAPGGAAPGGAGPGAAPQPSPSRGAGAPRPRPAACAGGAQAVLAAAAAGRVGRVVLVTSAMVYGAQPDNPVPLAESAPLGADSDGSVVGDLLEIEQLAQRSPQTNPGMAVTVVRPAALVGEGVDTLITRPFEAPRLLPLKGCAPRWQFCPVHALGSALERAAAG